MLTTIIGLSSLGIIVLVHEFGHYITAVYRNIVVEEFAIGIGPKLFSRTWRNTLWSIRLLPLGGFCKMKSSDLTGSGLTEPADSNTTIPQEEGSFNTASYLSKILVLFGGPLANIILFFLLSFVYFYADDGLDQDILAYIDPSTSPSIQSALQTGDLITKINDVPINSFTTLATTARTLLGQQVTIEYERDNKTAHTQIRLNDTNPALGVYPYIPPVVSYTPDNSTAKLLNLQQGDVLLSINGKEIINAIRIKDAIGMERNNSLPLNINIRRKGEVVSYQILPDQSSKGASNETGDGSLSQLSTWGIEYETVVIKKWENFGDFFSGRIKLAGSIMANTFLFLLDLLQLKINTIKENTAGPIRLIQGVGSSTISQAKSQGWFKAIVSFINITSILSIAIASLNLLPIPILDGGQICFYSFFRIKRKDPSIKAMLIYNAIGTVIMLLLFIFIIFFDITSFL